LFPNYLYLKYFYTYLIIYYL